MRIVLVAVAVMGAAATRAHADDADDACVEAKALAKKGDLTRARIVVDACTEGDRAHADIAKAIEAKGYSPVAIVTKPEGLAVAIDARADLSVKGGDEIWLPAGTYTFSAGGMATTITVKKGAHALVLLEVPGAAPAPTNGTIDFSDEGGGTVVNGPPPKIVHPNLIRDKWQEGMAGGGVDSGLDDSDPRVTERVVPRDERAGIGLRVAPAIATGASIGWNLGAVARSPRFGGWAAQLELAWARRGALDEVQVPLLAAYRLWHGDGMALDAHAGASLDVRFSDKVDGMSVARTGASAIGGLEVERGALHVDVRGEGGLTRDDAIGRGWAVSVGFGVLFQ